MKSILFATVALALGLSASAQVNNPVDLIQGPPISRVPTPDEMYMRGTFDSKKNLIWEENHLGEKVDLEENRPVVNLENTIFAEKYGKEGYTLVANVFHNTDKNGNDGKGKRGKLYIARVPKRGVKNVYFLLSAFPPYVFGQTIAEHSLKRFEMDASSPIELVAEVPSLEQMEKLSKMSEAQALRALPSELKGSTYKLHNVAISAEATGTIEDPKKGYDLVRGAKGAYIQVVRMVSMVTRFEELYLGGNPVVQYKLTDAEINKDVYLHFSMKKSQTEGLNHVYNTLNYNCTTIQFDIMEEAFGLKDNRFGFLRSATQRRVPTLTGGKLQIYGYQVIVNMELDPSLSKESKAAFENALVPKVMKDGADSIKYGDEKKAAKVVTEAMGTFTKELGISIPRVGVISCEGVRF